MVILKKKVKRQNVIKIHPKKHQIAPFKKNFSKGCMPPNPPSIMHGQHGFATSKLPNLKTNYCPPSLILATPLVL